MTLNDRWSLAGFADYGGFDGADDQSWELYGGANYAFAERWQGTFGYRYVSIQKKVTDRACARHRHPGAARRHHLQF